MYIYVYYCILQCAILTTNTKTQYQTYPAVNLKQNYFYLCDGPESGAIMVLLNIF